MQHALQMEEPPQAPAIASPPHHLCNVQHDSPTLTIDQLVDGFRSDERDAASEQPTTRTYLPRPETLKRSRLRVPRPRPRVPALPSKRMVIVIALSLMVLGGVRVAATLREPNVPATTDPLQSTGWNDAITTTLGSTIEIPRTSVENDTPRPTKPTRSRKKQPASGSGTDRPATSPVPRPTSSSQGSPTPRPSNPSTPKPANQPAPSTPDPTPAPATSPTTQPAADPATPSYDSCDPVNETC